MSPQQSGSSAGTSSGKQSDLNTQLQRALGIDIDALAENNPAQAHNLTEEWSAACGKMQEFYNKYGTQQ